jgi:hypothetical protein
MKEIKNINSLLDETKIDESFDKIAAYLFNDCEIHINGTVYYFDVLEFYYYGDKHPDKNTHGYKYKDSKGYHKQKTSNRLCFHDRGRGGVDLTFGDSNSYGGILIKGIRNAKGEKFGQICGFEIIKRYLQLDTTNRKQLNEKESNMPLPICESNIRRDVKFDKDKRKYLADTKDGYAEKEYRYIIREDK